MKQKLVFVVLICFLNPALFHKWPKTKKAIMNMLINYAISESGCSPVSYISRFLVYLQKGVDLAPPRTHVSGIIISHAVRVALLDQMITIQQELLSPSRVATLDADGGITSAGISTALLQSLTGLPIYHPLLGYISKGENDAERTQFGHFDVVSSAADHHYLTCNLKSRTCFEDANASVYAKIMKEWKILERNLPESILVQVYEERIDLLRAVIIGSAGTPYHDGLFFFDILLPSNYPENPPQVYYHSHGYRLNPNLYATGKVCLSLINTWSGSKAEKWRQESTILQVLVSIQGLVLNEQPYFNEPGFGSFRKSKSSVWIKRSIDYNENAFILSCKTMLQIMRSPPKNYESFVAQHFRGRAASIMTAIRAYHEGLVLVGQFQMDAPSCSSSTVKVPAKFKGDLVKIQSNLKKEFARFNIQSDLNLVEIGSEIKIESEPEMEKPENPQGNTANNDEGEQSSASTSKTGKDVKRGRHEKDPSSKVKPRESVAKHKNRCVDKLISFVKCV